MALARTSAGKFVLVAGDVASYPGVIYSSPLCLLSESIPRNPRPIDTVIRALAVHHSTLDALRASERVLARA